FKPPRPRRWLAPRSPALGRASTICTPATRPAPDRWRHRRSIGAEAATPAVVMARAGNASVASPRDSAVLSRLASHPVARPDAIAAAPGSPPHPPDAAPALPPPANAHGWLRRPSPATRPATRMHPEPSTLVALLANDARQVHTLRHRRPVAHPLQPFFHGRCGRAAAQFSQQVLR